MSRVRTMRIGALGVFALTLAVSPAAFGQGDPYGDTKKDPNGAKPQPKADPKPEPEPEPKPTPPPAPSAAPKPPPKARPKRRATTIELLKAKQLFRVGARAYQAGQYEAAIQAFEKAYAIVPRPTLRFSTAQALRRLFVAKRDQELLTTALRYYRQYLDEAPRGNRRLDATKGIEAVELRLGQLKVAAPAVSTRPELPKAVTGRVSIDSPTDGAVITFEGGEKTAAPFIASVAPGRAYSFEVSAPGYLPRSGKIRVFANDLSTWNQSLEEIKPILALSGYSGADVLVDGVRMGLTPLDGLPVSSGWHRIVAGDVGHELWVKDVNLERGEQRTVDVDVRTTAQRTAAVTLMIAGGAGLAAGGALLGFAALEEGNAADFENMRNNGMLTSIDPLNNAVDARNRLTLASGITLGVGAALGLTGLMLYAIDSPSLYSVPTQPNRSTDPATDGPADPSTFDVDARLIPMVELGGVAPTATGTQRRGTTFGAQLIGTF